ncbi:hypothetical protein [Metaclostridioides mangenotii]|uniref:hypothetical protein n=1 Tax=Metaclostridioides mangenotii TaxID=1540 RepID=UPI000A469E82|nr:hypothetical protein [Clostridioides mangenotii]
MIRVCVSIQCVFIQLKKGLKKFPDNITKFVGNDFKDTYRNVVEWLKDNNKYM